MGKNKKSSGQKDLKKRNALLQAEVNMLRQKVEMLTSQLAQIQRMLFGRKSEKVSSDQLALFAGHTSEFPTEETEDNNPEDDSSESDNQKKKKKPRSASRAIVTRACAPRCPSCKKPS